MEVLNRMLARNVRLVPDRTYLVAGDETITYRDFAARCARLAHVMAAEGVCRGDRVGLYLPSTPLMAVAFWACQRLGAVPVPVSAMLRHGELRHLVTKARMAALVADAGTWPYFAEIRDEFAGLRTCLVAGGPAQGAIDLDARCAAALDTFADADVDPSDVAAIFFTSGTTGTPKGTAQSHFNQCSSLRDMMVAHGTRYGTETYLCAVPLFTNYGLVVNLNLCMYTGGTLVLHERWDTRRVLEDVSLYRATYFGGTPTMYVYLVNEYDPARHDVSSLRVCTTGGSPVPQPVVVRFEEMSGVRVSQVYGATEVCGQAVMEPTVGLRRPGSAGLPVGSSRIAIVDPATGTALAPGETGEVVIGGDCVAVGYDGDPEATAAAFGPLGWRSGDVGYLDADGFLFIIDRIKDVILAGGHNIYPLEIETVLYRHPSVAMCAVVGVPDPEKGEIPVAVVVRAPGTADTAEDVRLWCRERLAAYKAPRRVEFIDEMPIEAAKIRKRDLVAAITRGELDRFRRS
jgi:long-chain acyl-CoA synthetase